MSEIYYQIVISLLFSGFFSGLEIAYVSRNKLNFEIKAKKGGLVGSIFSLFNRNNSQFIATMVLGNNLALVLYGILMAQLLEPIIFNLLPVIIKNDFFVLVSLTFISTNPDLKGAPSGHEFPIREVRLSSGAEFIVVICGSIMTMPGLPSLPAANSIKLNDKGEIEGLF